MRKIIDLLKKAIIPAIIALCIFILYFITKGCSGDEEKKLEFDKVSVGEVKKTISVTGVLEVLDLHIVLSKTNGIVTDLYADFNQQVKKGQLLAKIDSSSIDQELMKISAQRESSKLEIASAQKELEAKKSMFNDSLISKTEMQNAELKYRTVSTKHKQILIDYDLALKQKSYARITSPISGVIISRTIAKDAPAAVNSILFEIAPNLKKMQLIINIDESDIGNIQNNQKVTFSVSAFPEKIFSGKISQVRIKPLKREGLVTYQSVVTCDNEELLLKPGMTATATVVVKRKENALRVLNHAFVASPEDQDFDPDRRIVWIKSKDLIENKLLKIEVETGIIGDKYTEITKNLKKDDKVLIRVTRKDSSN